MPVDLLDLLEIDIDDDDTWVGVLNGDIPLEDVLDFQAILSRLVDYNEEYCNEHDLCPECRHVLVAMRETYEVWGHNCSEPFKVCPCCG